jgi:hypothetical protein
MENLRKKNQTETLTIRSYLNQTKNTEESHSSRLQQVEERISRLEDKTDIKETTGKLLDKNSKATKGIYKNSATASKDQTHE